jgi:hypothetical protein
MVGTGMKVACGTSGPAVAAGLHVPEEDFAEDNEGGAIAHIV